MSATDPVLEMDAIEKAFFGVKVLQGVSFTLPAHGMLGIVGENGAGKSTLMNILGGNMQPDRGAIRLAGQEYTPRTSNDAARRGIAFIHQELNLFLNLSIAENLFLARLPRISRTPFIDRASMDRRAVSLLGEVGLDLPPHRLVESLSAGERQLVEIAKALSIDARLIIFDEPTTSLSVRETERLFQLIGRLRARGMAMIYISHTLPHVLGLCDDVVVLRDGAVVGSGPVSDFSHERLVSLMVGRTLQQVYPSRNQSTPGEFALQVEGISQPGVVSGISFTLRRGELVGWFGLMGAGRSELARILFGLDSCSSGRVRLSGESVRRPTPRKLVQRGMAFLTENRHSEGLCLDAAVADNITLATLRQHARGPAAWLSRESLRRAVRRIREVIRLDPKTRDSQPVRTLSGGNQQKVVFGKWLLHEPQVLILDEPTRGIDVGAKFEIYQLVHALADRGAAVMLISSEMDELLALCDRIIVMRRGEIVDAMDRPEFDRERILRAALGTGRTGGVAL